MNVIAKAGAVLAAVVVILGLGVLILMRGSRPPSAVPGMQPAASEAVPLAPAAAAQSEPPPDAAAASGEKEQPTAEEVQRYPLIDAPDPVRVGQEFAVEVSLTEQQFGSPTKIVGGRATPEGKLAMQLPATMASWKIDVVLSATGFDFTQGTNTGSMVLPRAGDSTPVVFHLRAVPFDGAQREAPIRATLWHDGAYLGRIERSMVVLATASSDAARPMAGVPAAAPAPAPADQVAPPLTSTRALAGIEIDSTFETPDLTVYVLDRTDVGAGSTTEIIINSAHLQPARYEVPRVPGRREWIAAQLATLAQRGRGLDVQGATPASAADFARGLGRQLYRDCAPAPFKDAFWKLAKTLGDRFRTIQIVTDDPSFPWELLRPSSPDGGAERDFLGLEFDVARWHVGTDAPEMQRPPQQVVFERLTVMAPRYQGSQALPAQATELGALKQMPGFASVAGSVEGLRELFQHPPAGIIHFAGHGSAHKGPAGATFAIRLEDGDVDVMSWRGMVEPSERQHPFVFFNACDVGAAQATAGLIEGWAPALLSTGASGYIGALWAVNDRRAAEFAAEFYAHINQDLKTGPSLPGRVLADTRRALFARTGDPTALAYVLYGDPLLRFTRGRQ